MRAAIEQIYQPPRGSAEPPKRTRPVRFRGYKSLLRLGNIVAIFLGCSAIQGLFTAALETYAVFLLNDYAAGVPGTEEAMGTVASLEATTEIVGGVVALCTSATFLTWVHRVHGNIPALGKPTDVTARGAVWAYFIPFINFVRPYRHMMQAWRQSAPRRNERDKPSPVGWWWAAWVGRGIVGGVAALTARITESVGAESLHRAGVALIVLNLIGIVVALLCIRVVLQLSQRQESAAARHKRRLRKKQKREKAVLIEMFGSA